jgi:hypothetical protein
MGEISKAPFGSRDATLELSPAQRAGCSWQKCNRPEGTGEIRHPFRTHKFAWRETRHWRVWLISNVASRHFPLPTINVGLNFLSDSAAGAHIVDEWMKSPRLLSAVVMRPWNLARRSVPGTCGENENVLKGQGKSSVPSGRINSLGARPDTGVSGLFPMSLRDTSLYPLQTSTTTEVSCAFTL